MLEGFTLRRLLVADRPKSLKAGSDAYNNLKTFAQRHAQKYESEGLARTYVLYDDVNRCLAAYMTMVCSEVTSEQDNPPIQADGLTYPYLQWPSVKISRLLVDARYRREGERWKDGQRIGEGLVRFAIGIAQETVCPAVGCRFMVVDAHSEAVGFYKKLGFSLLDTEENRDRKEPIMFIDMHKARDTDPDAANADNDDAEIVADAETAA